MILPDPAHIIANLTAQSRKEALTEMSGLFPDLAQDLLIKSLLNREDLGSTAIANGVALPHCKITTIDDILIGVGRSKTGIHWGAKDGQPVQLIVLMIAPLQSSANYLRNLANLSRFLKNSSNCALVHKARDGEEIQHIFHSARELSQ
ncbi:MAG: PTS sugar transporter subunit IIA [Desulfobulbaceae bacterium]|jgi:PTS system nitrogen regulatory IIA component|nr:PTS sugar transporter subunit IIA [Desulfobulbaceae bacterium]